MPLRLILFKVAQGSADSSLGRTGMTADRQQLGDNGCPIRAARAAGFERRVQTRAAGTHYHGIELVL
jgi:hypothetical protein